MQIKNLYGGITEVDDKMFRSVPHLYEIERFIHIICDEFSYKEEYYIYIHKTHKENVYGIIRNGLRINEIGVESTMSRIFRTEIDNRDLWINYALNSIITSNAYGDYSVIALFSKNDYDRLVTANHVPQKNIILVLDPNGNIIYSTMYQIVNELKSSTNHLKN